MDESGTTVLPLDTGEHGTGGTDRLPEGDEQGLGQPPPGENVHTGGGDPPPLGNPSQEDPSLTNDPNRIAPAIVDTNAT